MPWRLLSCLLPGVFQRWIIREGWAATASSMWSVEVNCTCGCSVCWVCLPLALYVWFVRSGVWSTRSNVVKAAGCSYWLFGSSRVSVIAQFRLLADSIRPPYAKTTMTERPSLVWERVMEGIEGVKITYYLRSKIVLAVSFIFK